MTTEDHVPGLDMAIAPSAKTIPPEELDLPPMSAAQVKTQMLRVVQSQKDATLKDSYVLGELDDHQLSLVATFIESFGE